MGKGKCAVCGAVYYTSGGDGPVGCTGKAETCPHSPGRKKAGRAQGIGEKRRGQDKHFGGGGVEGTK